MSLNNDKAFFYFSEVLGVETWVCIDGWNFKIENIGTKRLKSKKSIISGSGEFLAPMPGQILKIFVKKGQKVEEGDSLFIVEAMKIEHTLKATYPGTVMDLDFKDGDTVSRNDVILRIKKDD